MSAPRHTDFLLEVQVSVKCVETDRRTNRASHPLPAVLSSHVVDLLEDVLEPAVVGFEDGVLGAAGGGVRVM